MSDFKNAVVFGLAIRNQFNELVIDPNTALRNLGLIPRDFFVLRNIGKTGEFNPGIPNTFQKLSNLNENLILKLDSLKRDKEKSFQNKEFVLPDNSLLIMGGGSQRNFCHFIQNR